MDLTRALRLQDGQVHPDWVDEFGHMNMARYVEACDLSTYALWEFVNRPRTLEQREGFEYAVVETHVNYLSELHDGDPYYVLTQLLGTDDKRIWMYHELYHGEREELVATNEVMALGFDLNQRRLMRFLPEVRERLAELLAHHKLLPMPKNASRSIAMSSGTKEKGAASGPPPVDSLGTA
jgi:acyl-CoA thioester hydrolase